MPSSVTAAWSAASLAVAESVMAEGALGAIAETIGATTATALAFAGNAAVQAGASYAISAGLSSLLSSGGSGGAPAAPSPTGSAFNVMAQARTHMLRSTVANRQIVYGQAMLSGPVVFGHSNDNFGTMHLVIALAGHECESIDDVYFNDEPLGALDADGYPTTGRFYQPTQPGGTLTVATQDNQGVNREPQVVYQFHYVTLPQAPVSISITDVGLTMANSPTGTPYKDSGGTWSNVGYENVASGMKKNYPNDPGPGYIPHRQFGVNGTVVKMSASHSEGGDITITYTTASGKSYLARIRKHLGSPNQVADAELVALNAGWTNEHRGRGVAYIVASMVYDKATYPRGIPNIKAVVKGRKLYDPRTATTAWSDNPALVARDYITGAHGLGCSADEVGDASFISAANICDELVVVDTLGTTQKRFTCNGVVDTGQRPLDILDAIVSSFGGMLVWQAGQWVIHAGAYTAPVGPTLTADDARGEIEINPHVPGADLFNAVKGTFVDPARGYLPQDFPIQRNATYVADDGGREVMKDLTLPFTNNPIMAQRLAKMVLDRARQGIVVTWPGMPRLLGGSVGDTKRITLPHLGWTDKEFRIISYSLSETLAVDYVMQEEAAASYAWNYGNATLVDPAPDTALPSPWVVILPTGLTVTSGTAQLLRLADGTIISRMYASWDTPPLGVSRTDLRYRRLTDAAWQDLPNINSPSAWLMPVEDGSVYIVQVRYANAMGFDGQWVSVEHTVVGKSERPSNVQGFMIDADTLSWPEVTDADLDGYRIRYHYGSTNTSWGTANDLHTGLLTSSPYTMITRPTGPVVLMIKAVDTSGNESLDIAAIFTDLGDPVVANVVISNDYHAAAFPGALTACSIDVGSGDLVANSATTFWNANADVSMWSLNSAALMWGTAAYSAMSYDFSFEPIAAAAGHNLTLPSAITGSAWSISYRQRGINLMWGASGAPMWATADAMWSSDPLQPMWLNSSSAMWLTTGDMWTAPGFSPWPGAITAQRDIYDFRIGIDFGSPQGRISALRAQVDVPDRLANFADVAIPSSGLRLPIGAGWFAVTNVNMQLQDDGGSAASAKIIDKSASLGPLVKVFNSSGVATSGVLDAIVQGY